MEGVDSGGGRARGLGGDEGGEEEEEEVDSGEHWVCGGGGAVLLLWDGICLKVEHSLAGYVTSLTRLWGEPKLYCWNALCPQISWVATALQDRPPGHVRLQRVGECGMSVLFTKEIGVVTFLLFEAVEGVFGFILTIIVF